MSRLIYNKLDIDLGLNIIEENNYRLVKDGN